MILLCLSVNCCWQRILSTTNKITEVDLRNFSQNSSANFMKRSSPHANLVNLFPLLGAYKNHHNLIEHNKNGRKKRVTVINDYVDTNDDYCKHDEK